MRIGEYCATGTAVGPARAARGPVAGLFAAALAVSALSGCMETASEPQSQSTHFGQFFWQGNVCMTRTLSGRPKRVSPTNCPPRE